MMRLPVGMISLVIIMFIYIFYSMNYPTECSYKAECMKDTPQYYESLWNAMSMHHTRDVVDDARRIACRRYERSCYSPLWSDKSHIVDIHFYINDATVVEANGQRVVNSRPRLIWNVTGHRTSQRLVSNITYHLSAESTTGDSVSGTFYFISRNSDIPVISLQIVLAERRKLIGGDRRRTRKLIDYLNDSSTRDSGLGTTTAKKIIRSSYHGYERDDGDGTESAFFWKFLYHPITIRFAEVYAHVSRHTLTSLLAHDITVHDTAGRSVHENKHLRIHSSPRYKYEPLLWLDELSITQKQYAVINMPSMPPSHNESTVVEAMTTSVSFEFEYVPTSPLYFGIKKIAEIQLLHITNHLNLNSHQVIDELRYYLSERHLYQLIITQLIAMIHILLEYLAFRDDLSFFRSQRSFKGISSSALYFAFARNLIVFFYLLDNNTSWIVLISVAKDAVYALWKIVQVLHPSIIAACSMKKRSMPSNASSELKTLVVVYSKDELKIMDYDSIAVRYCSYLLCPLLAILSAYNLKTHVYVSWWSWGISSLVDFVYLFGFISMVPQLYINYKLQSVEHLPIRAFMFKLFNTFIDDVFVLMTKMPLKHRLMALRDDVIFLGFLYQWWVYPSDKARTNEFGYQYEAIQD